MRADQALPDDVDRVEVSGVAVRKGTVGAFLHNARAWTASSRDDATRQAAGRDIVEAVPALRAIGLFDVLEVRDQRLRASIDSLWHALDAPRPCHRGGN